MTTYDVYSSKAVTTLMCWKLWIFYAFFVRYYRFVEILSCPTYPEESSRLRPLRHRGFHNRYHWWCNQRFHKWWCNKRLKQFVCSRCQFCDLSHQWINNDCLQIKNLKVHVPVFISNVSNLSCPYTSGRKLQIKTITSSL